LETVPGMRRAAPRAVRMGGVLRHPVTGFGRSGFRRKSLREVTGRETVTRADTPDRGGR